MEILNNLVSIFDHYHTIYLSPIDNIFVVMDSKIY